MRFFALQTDVNAIKRRFLSDGECEVLMTYYHGASFLFASVREIVITITLFLVGVVSWYVELPMGITIVGLFAVWLFFVFFNLLKAWIDWNYDFILVTTDRVILVDQTSIIREKTTPLHHENIASVSSVSQYWDLFRFGRVIIRLKEGEGGDRIILDYVPNAKEVAAKISAVVTLYQRRRGGAAADSKSG